MIYIHYIVHITLNAYFQNQHVSQSYILYRIVLISCPPQWSIYLLFFCLKILSHPPSPKPQKWLYSIYYFLNLYIHRGNGLQGERKTNSSCIIEYNGMRVYWNESLTLYNIKYRIEVKTTQTVESFV